MNTANPVKSAQALVLQLQGQDPDPKTRLSPFLEFSRGADDFWLNRGFLKNRLSYEAEKVLLAGEETSARVFREDIGKWVNKLSCDAALANVIDRQGQKLSPLVDDVGVVHAIGGLTLETLETIVSRFDYSDDLVFVVSKHELEQLNGLGRLFEHDKRFFWKDGVLTHFFGMAIVPVYTYNGGKPILGTQQGIRKCFVLKRGGIIVQVHWSLDGEKNYIAVEIGAVRVDGEKLLSVETIA